MMQPPRVELDRDGYPIYVQPVTLDWIAGFKPSNPDDVAVVSQYLTDAGISDPWSMMQAQVKYLERFGITSESPDFSAQLQRLAEESYSSRVAIATGRRVAQQQEFLSATDGQVGQICVYLNEGPDPCPACLELSGEMHPYSWFVMNGARPGDRCYGGGNCLCALIPVD